MKYLKTKWTAVAAVAVTIVIFAAFSFGHSNTPQYVTAKAETGSIRDVVQLTGTIDAVKTVQVGSQVSGVISALYADFNSPVKKDQVIARIDPALFQGALLQAQADLQNALATEAAARAQLGKEQATAVQKKLDYDRTVALASAGVLSTQQLDAAKADNDTAQAAVAADQAAVKQAAAQVEQKRAAVEVAKTNLDHTIIRAPIDGVVTARNVDVGQTVAASLQAPTLFNIAQDLTKMRVYAKTDESDVGTMKPGQIATFKVDAFPKDTFTGKVEQVRMNPTTVQNVVTYDTVIAFDNPQTKLFPGMTAYVSVPVANADNVLKVPDAALRFKPARNAGATQPGAQAQQKQGAADVATIWKLGADKKLTPVVIRTGITDHTFTEVAQVMKGELQPGDVLATGSATAPAKSASTAAGPGGMRGMGR